MVPIVKEQFEHPVVGFPDIYLLTITNGRRLNSGPVFLIGIVGQALISLRTGRVLLLLDDLVYIGVCVWNACQQWTALPKVDLLLSVPADGAPCRPPVGAFSSHEQAQSLFGS
ncbi:LOW QUALITY PROTEIN: hypothetical protein MKX08_008358 [Trichoderma sp. CBMAI-0020]|nr:LOW QUALITY PROTEIN: hypothetical protein MKX08_008358 [Trichoderma sp. CBMAI-0020]